MRKSTEVKELEESLRREKGLLQHWTYLLENRDHKTKRLSRIIAEAQAELAEVEIERLRAPESVVVIKKNVSRLENKLMRTEALSDPRARRLLRLKAELLKLEGEEHADS